MSGALTLTLKGLKTSFKEEDEGSFKRRMVALESSIYSSPWIENDPNGPHRHLNGSRIEYKTRDGLSGISRGEFLDFKLAEEEYSIIRYRVLQPYADVHFPSEPLYNAIELLNNCYENEDRVALEKVLRYLEYRLKVNPEEGWISNAGIPPNVPENEGIEIKLRNGESHNSSLEGLRWSLIGQSSDIMSYRRIPTLP